MYDVFAVPLHGYVAKQHCAVTQLMLSYSWDVLKQFSSEKSCSRDA